MSQAQLSTTSIPASLHALSGAASPVRRRRYPLLSLDFQVRFDVEGEVFTTEAFELSNELLRLRCQAGDIPKIVPRTAHHRPDEKVELAAQLLVDGQQQIEARLQVKSCRRYSQKEFHVTLALASLAEQDRQALEAFLQQALSNNAPHACVFG
ncbi:hypothetical protein V6U78_12010 [Marinospirillum sp. MEB164]|uniref:PilZ domain-containing protein n=1 Tax=Marinospirillum alkalitolerans TaxID=3123374 RepID=A0ABW8PZN8_9GAMM